MEGEKYVGPFILSIGLVYSSTNSFSTDYLPFTIDAFEKNSQCVWKESCVSTGVRKLGNKLVGH